MASGKLLAEGREAEVFVLDDGRVLKLMRDASSGERVQREAAVCRLLMDTDVSAPVVHDVVTVDQRPGLVMDRIDGVDLLHALQRRPLKVFSAARVLAQTHAALHGCTGPSALPQAVDELHDRILAAVPLPSDLKELALRVLEDLPRGECLCHGDFHLGNILGNWNAPVVIDWAYAARGDPTSDVARTELLHRIGVLPTTTPRTFKAVARVGRQILIGRYLRLYRQARPLDDSLGRWLFVHAAARLAEPVSEEHPACLDLLRRAAPTHA